MFKFPAVSLMASLFLKCICLNQNLNSAHTLQLVDLFLKIFNLLVSLPLHSLSPSLQFICWQKRVVCPEELSIDNSFNKHIILLPGSYDTDTYLCKIKQRGQL